ncbi:MAG: LysR family transcriptional regulator [Spirulinaceae cyanobacterium SM2_1_0]|nr:LysR family transcriptional regulator [Spirulinaceae cyanobacterium SM2_1_0]
MDKFESLRAFTHVVERGSFAAAARHLELSRSAVNKLVAKLETELGVQLLQRTTRCVSPTESGRAFYARSVEILAALAEAERAVSQLQAEPKGMLRINAPMTFGSQFLAAAIARFAVQYPDLRLELTLNDRLVDPIEEGFDLTVRIATPPTSPALIVQRLAPIERVLCAAPSYLQAQGTPQYPSELRDRPCLHYGYLTSGNQWQLVGPTGEQAVTIHSTFCSNNGEALREAAIRGLGITLLPNFMVAQALSRGELAIVLPKYQPPLIWLCLLYPSHHHLSAKVRLLTEFLQAQFGDRPDWQLGSPPAGHGGCADPYLGSSGH